jgi:tRNA(fMet)-specific endonuclease VapC
MIKFMLDTNICIYVIKRKPVELLNKFNVHQNEICISSIVLSELLHGVEKSEQKSRNAKRVNDFVSRLEVINYDEKSAFHYGEIRTALEKNGQIIGVNDLHIAAHARSESLVLVSNNLREFDRVSALRTENWAKN